MLINFIPYLEHSQTSLKDSDIELHNTKAIPPTYTTHAPESIYENNSSIFPRNAPSPSSVPTLPAGCNPELNLSMLDVPLSKSIKLSSIERNRDRESNVSSTPPTQKCLPLNPSSSPADFLSPPSTSIVSSSAALSSFTLKPPCTSLTTSSSPSNVLVNDQKLAEPLGELYSRLSAQDDQLRSLQSRLDMLVAAQRASSMAAYSVPMLAAAAVARSNLMMPLLVPTIAPLVQLAQASNVPTVNPNSSSPGNYSKICLG